MPVIEELKERFPVKKIEPSGLTMRADAKKLAKESRSKIKRVIQSKTYWKDLTRFLREYSRYWKDHAGIRERETVLHYNLELRVSLPKDLQE